MRLTDSGHGMFFNIIDNTGKLIVSDSQDPNEYRTATPYSLKKP
jgi:hypothetical protein